MQLPSYFPWYPYKAKGNTSYGFKLLTWESVFLVLLEQLWCKKAYGFWVVWLFLKIVLGLSPLPKCFLYRGGLLLFHIWLKLPIASKIKERFRNMDTAHKTYFPKKAGYNTQPVFLPAVAFLWETAASRSQTSHSSSSTGWKASHFKLHSWVNWFLI